MTYLGVGMDTATLIGLLVVLALSAPVAWFFWHQTKIKGRWGIKFSGTCPRCGTQMPRLRKPDSLQQALWGGWTCPNCGAKLDKYGREIAA